jgi:hypothetical protein
VRPQLGGDDLSGLPSQLAAIIRALRDLAHSEPTVLDNDRRLENLLRKQASTLPLGAANYCWFKDPAKAYSTYLHLKEEFESRRNRMREAGEIADPRVDQIERLKDQVVKLTERVVSKDEEIEALTAFKQTAISRLAAALGDRPVAGGVGQPGKRPISAPTTIRRGWWTVTVRSTCCP